MGIEMVIDKKFLRDHAEKRKELCDELERYELNNGKSYYGKSPSDINGMPNGSSEYQSKTESSAIRRCDTESYIGNLEQEIKEETRRIDELIKILPTAKEKYVIRLKYYQCLEWDDITDWMYGNVSGYCRNTEQYKQKAMKIHGIALSKMVAYQAEHGDKV